MRRSPMTWLVAAVTALAVTACSQRPDPDSLYPLTPGLQWKYRIETQRKGSDPVRQIRVMTNVKREDFGTDKNVTVRRNNFGTRYYVVERDDGLYRVATKSLIDQHPIVDQPLQQFLPLPAKVGASWREATHTYMLDRAKTFITTNNDDNTVVLDYRIEKTDAEVTVPAGAFRGCVLAVGKTTFHLGSGVGFAPTDVPIVQREWYCPGVGLVRISRDERVTSAQKMITGGHMEIELITGPE